VILATVSPHLQALFGNQMAESQSRVVELQQLGWTAVTAIVDFAYTGTIAWANRCVYHPGGESAAGGGGGARGGGLLGGAAGCRERVERDGAGRAPFGGCDRPGAAGQGAGHGWTKNSGWSEPSFLEPPVSEFVSFVASDDLEASEEVVFEAVLAWVKEDEATRKTELDRLLPLVRFPRMKEPATAMQAEPLVATKII
jgi:hypothetical protein